MNNSPEHFNSALHEFLAHQEEFAPDAPNLLTYRGPSDTCRDLPTGKLANMAGGFPHFVLGRLWKSTEHLYLCGEWSNDTAEHRAIQEDVLKATSGYAAKRYKKTKHKRHIRPDFASFRYDWMLWCVWQKCLGSEPFARLLRSIPDDSIIVELVAKDPVWAAYPTPSDNSAQTPGLIRGGNAMGKILTLCRNHLIEGTEPPLDRQRLNDAGIYILGQKVAF